MKENRLEALITQSSKTVLLYFMFCVIWWSLELIFYQEIQPRVVDDIMSILLVPIIWKAVEEKEKVECDENNENHEP